VNVRVFVVLLGVGRSTLTVEYVLAQLDVERFQYTPVGRSICHNPTFGNFDKRPHAAAFTLSNVPLPFDTGSGIFLAADQYVIIQGRQYAGMVRSEDARYNVFGVEFARPRFSDLGKLLPSELPGQP
jgi:hypothetical protein